MIMRKTIVLLIALVGSAQAAQRSVYFSGIAQSHITADTFGSGKIHLSCVVTIQNIAATATERVRDFGISFESAVPTGAGLQPTLKNIVTTGTPSVRAYRFCTANACAVSTTTSIPTNGSNMIQLNPPGTAGNYDGVHFRAAMVFPYFVASTYEGGGNPPANQHVMHYCTGRITVEDVSSAAPGAAVATGALEVVADNYQNPQVTYGVATATNGAAGASAVSSSPETYDNQGQWGYAQGICNWGLGACYVVGPINYGATGAGCGTGGRHLLDLSAIPYPGGLNECYYGGDATAYTAGGYGVPVTQSCLTANTYDKGQARSYYAFPQHIANVPIMINSGKPF